MEEFVGVSEYANGGERVVAGQRIMQATSDIFLGWLHVPESVFGQERDYYLRQLRDWKGSLVVEAMDPARSASTAVSARLPWRTPTPARATGSRSRAISGGAMSSTVRS